MSTASKTNPYIPFIVVIWSVLMVCCCRSGREQPAADPYQSGLSSSDTSAVLSETGRCLELIMSGDYDSALWMIGYIDVENTLCHLEPERADALRCLWSSMCLTGYELEDVEFRSPSDNSVTYRVTFGGGEGSPLTTRMSFSPVRIDGSWYLRLRE